VARDALDLVVRAVQREVGIAGVIERDVRPLRRLVAIGAFRAVAAFVLVVVGVAAIALRRRLRLVLVALVARLAHQAAMPARQRETRGLEVVEPRVLPIRGRVTAFALRAVEPHVLVVLAVAAYAGVGRSLVVLVDVAAHALVERRVRAGQCVARRELVIEAHVRPARFRMAVRARFAEIAEMPIVVAVTTDALRLGRVEGRFRRVAVDAHEVGVLAEQLEVSEPVIERALVEPQDVGVPALVIRVAGGALLVRHVRRVAMEAGRGREVFRDLVMAVQTQLPLRLPLEAHMARPAFRLVLRMRARERPGHHEPLECFDLRLRVRKRRHGRRSRQYPHEPSAEARPSPFRGRLHCALRP
jgi:hypothetical protein